MTAGTLRRFIKKENSMLRYPVLPCATISVVLLFVFHAATVVAQQNTDVNLKSSLLLHVPFDGTLDARTVSYTHLTLPTKRIV